MSSTAPPPSRLDGESLVVAVLPQGLASPPQRPEVPPGPVVSDNSVDVRRSQARTYPVRRRGGRRGGGRGR